jgi:exonuclease SbcC
MHITKIELEDIKSHAHFVQEFQRGTIAITGENGAGKTTLIEAVAWTLFDLLDYKKDDFVRRGQKKGVVNVTFESSLDEREYRVYRDTGTGYYVYDPQLKTRIADKKEEVTRFLWQHLGVEAGTDLESLFRRAIGVPQGTFTAIFIETPAERKKAFDKLLKVEEYRQGADKLLETARYIETQISAVRENIARAEGELAQIERLEIENKDFNEQVKNFSESLEKLTGEVKSKSEIVKKFDEKETKVNEIKNSLDKSNSDFSRAEFVEKQKTTEKTQAFEAQEKIKSVESDYKIHIESLGKLKELDRERVERDKINAELKRVETAQVNVKAEQKSIAEKLDSALKAHKEIKELEPKTAEQENFEKELETLRNSLAGAKAAENQIKSLDEKLNDLRRKYSDNQTQIKESETKSVEAKHLEERQKRDSQVRDDLAKFRAKLESDRKFQEEIKNGLCPILSEKCLNLKPGQTLENFVSTQFTEITSQISTLEIEQKTLTVALRTSREAEKFLAQLNTLKNREKEIGDEGKKLKEEKLSLEKSIENLPKVKSDLAEVEGKLKVLDNPKARIKILQTEANNEINLREKRTEIEKNLERLENDRGILVEQLESYKFLDSNWKEFSEKRDKTTESHRLFLANESLAKTLSEKEKELETAKAEVTKLKKTLEKIQAELATASKDYDRDTHQNERSLLLEAERKSAETKANLENAKKRADETEKELARLAEVRKAMQAEFQEKERLEKIGEATKFIRETLKEAAPLVARNYVHHVSLEANQMFREISGNAEHTLKWTEDYGILLEESGHERPFVNLSGGEQMAAALSVRLALLKQLSDVRLAFFDEPTTNMDLQRRERLAEQISQITEKQTFDQLFVISHDDTFEGYVDNVVSVNGGENE